MRVNAEEGSIISLKAIKNKRNMEWQQLQHIGPAHIFYSVIGIEPPRPNQNF